MVQGKTFFFQCCPTFSVMFSVLCMWAFTGTTIIICFTLPGMSQVAFFGQIWICSSGFHCFPSLPPGWGGNHFEQLPTAVYGFVLFMAATSYHILQRCIITADGNNSVLRKAVGADWKGKLSIALYLPGIGLSFVFQWAAQAIYVGVALIWLVPDKRIERVINENWQITIKSTAKANSKASRACHAPCIIRVPVIMAVAA